MIGLGVVEVILAWWGLSTYLAILEEMILSSIFNFRKNNLIVSKELSYNNRFYRRWDTGKNALRSTQSNSPKYEDVSLRETRITSELNGFQLVIRMLL